MHAFSGQHLGVIRKDKIDKQKAKNQSNSDPRRVTLIGAHKSFKDQDGRLWLQKDENHSPSVAGTKSLLQKPKDYVKINANVDRYDKFQSELPK